jgi:hypothetical protein
MILPLDQEVHDALGIYGLLMLERTCFGVERLAKAGKLSVR